MLWGQGQQQHDGEAEQAAGKAERPGGGAAGEQHKKAFEQHKAERLAAAEAKTTDPKTLLNYADVQTRVADAAWSELKAPKGKGKAAGDIDSLRRNLQREHVRRLTAGLLRPAPAAAADVRSVNRMVAVQLEQQLKSALAAGGWNAITQAHLLDSQAQLSDALKATFTKT